MIAKAKIVAGLFGANLLLGPVYAVTSINLAWDPSPSGVSGYRLYSLMQGSSQASITDVGNVTSAVVQNLVDGQTYTFYVTAYDGNQIESDPSNSINFVNGSSANHPPVLQPIANQVADEGRELRITLQASDPDAGQTLKYSLGSNVPAGATINTNTGVFTWTPTASQAPSTNQITLIVTDSGSPAMGAQQTFTVVVRAGAILAVTTTSSSQNLAKGSVQVNPRGTLNPEGTKYIYGASVSATAQAQNGGYFSHWTLNGATYTQNPLSFQMNGNQSLTANFGVGGGGIKLTSTTTTQPLATSTTSTTTSSLTASSTTVEPTNSYVLESSTNLVEWNTVTNVVASSDLDTNSVFRIRAATEQ
jgi:hypothetical protein